MEKILIIVDMQKDFVDGSLGTKEAQAIVPAVKEKIENFNGDIIFSCTEISQVIGWAFVGIIIGTNNLFSLSF